MLISKDKKTMDETFVYERELKMEDAEKLKLLIEETGINSLPSDKYIEGWEYGLDGTTYSIEHRVGNKYSMKNYWTPRNQTGAKEAERFNEFMDEMLELISGSDLEIPYQQYTYYGVAYTVFNLNWKKALRKKASKRKER